MDLLLFKYSPSLLNEVEKEYRRNKISVYMRTNLFPFLSGAVSVMKKRDFSFYSSFLHHLNRFDLLYRGPPLPFSYNY